MQPNFNGRQYFYQACTELGRFPTMNSPKDSLLSNQLQLGFYKDFCTRLFRKSILPDVRSTNDLYGGLDIPTSYIIATVAQDDLFKDLTILNENSIDRFVLRINCHKCTHGVELTKAPTEYDPDVLKEAREFIAKAIDHIVTEKNLTSTNYPEYTFLA